MCSFAAFGLYATKIEPFRLQLEQTVVLVAPARAGPPIRVGVLADIQAARVTAYERGAVDRLMDLAPDVILLPGDLFQREAGRADEDMESFRDLLSGLHSPGGVYFVLGNVDSRRETEQLLADTQVKLLVNEIAEISLGERRLSVGGIELDFRTPAARATIDRLDTAPGSDVRILLTHMPDPVLTLPAGPRIDLVVAGHTHGGQVQLPLFGPPITLSAVPRTVGAGGLHDLGDGRSVYVSRGIGVERGQAPPIRFLCPPELALLELH